MIVAFFELILYALSPRHRAKIARKYGWYMCFGAMNHLILSWDRDDIEACSILNDKMRELNR
jgi:hypothetical protein